MQDNFPDNSASSQARNFEAITPNDDDELPRRYKTIYVGIGGAIVLVGDNDPDGDGVLHNVPDGAILIVSPLKIMATGTDADNIVGWF